MHVYSNSVIVPIHKKGEEKDCNIFREISLMSHSLKNPFKYQGLSIIEKFGVMHVGDKQQDLSPYRNVSMRLAKKINEKFKNDIHKIKHTGSNTKFFTKELDTISGTLINNRNLLPVI